MAAAITDGYGLGGPIYGCPFAIAIELRDAAGAIVSGAANPDSEVNKDTGGFGDCDDEITEVGSSGWYVLGLTAVEMQASCVCVQIKTDDTVPRTITLYPTRPVVIADDTAQAGAAGTITLHAGANKADDFYSGCVVLTDGGTGPGQARRIVDYDGGTKVASVAPNWGTNPDVTTTFQVLLLPERSWASEIYAFDAHARMALGEQSDVSDGTIKVYDGPDPDTATLLFTLTRGVVGDEVTWVKS